MELCPCGEACGLICLSCKCDVDEHFIPDANMLAESGSDWEEAYCSGNLNCCAECGNCYM
jgi:hypothetical protein